MVSLSLPRTVSLHHREVGYHGRMSDPNSKVLFERAQRVIKRGAVVSVIHELPVVNALIRMKTTVTNDDLSKFGDIRKELDEQMEKLEADYL